MTTTFKKLSTEESKEMSALKEKIYDAMSKKAINEMVACDKNNPARYGGVSFFFSSSSDGSYLVWDTPVNEWNETEIMKDIDEQERYVARLRGFVE